MVTGCKIRPITQPSFPSAETLLSVASGSKFTETVWPDSGGGCSGCNQAFVAKKTEVVASERVTMFLQSQ